MLTTVSIPKSCVTDTWILSVDADGSTAVGLGNPSDTDCWPGNRPLTTTISPAICPVGYTSACTPDGHTRHDVNETVWACCPSGGFHCDGGVYSCVMTLKEGNPHTLVVGTDDAGRNAITTVTSEVVINVHSVRVAFHSFNIINQAATVGVTAAPSPTDSLSTPTSTGTGTTPTQNAQALSPGAWVGVGIGSTVGALLLFSGLIWLLRKHYQNKKRNGPVELPSGNNNNDNNNNNQSWTPKFFTRTPASELGPSPVMYELDNRAS